MKFNHLEYLRLYFTVVQVDCRQTYNSLRSGEKLSPSPPKYEYVTGYVEKTAGDKTTKWSCFLSRFCTNRAEACSLLT